MKTINKNYEVVAFDDILEKLKEQAGTPQAKALIEELAPYLSETELRRNLRETSQARQMLDLLGLPPVPAMENIQELLGKIERYELLRPSELEDLGIFLTAVKRMRDYLERGKIHRISAAYYNENLEPSEELRAEIERCVRYGKIDDYASPALQDIRKKLRLLEEKLKEKAESILRTQKKYMTESFIVNRSGRICLPVKKEYKAKIEGSIVDKSGGGGTLFIEPSSVARLREEKELLNIEEDNEERRIIYTLMAAVEEEKEVFCRNLQTIVKLDFMFAKGKLSAEMNAIEPRINTDRRISLKDAAHPLLEKESCVPLSFEIGEEKRGIIITGPNTGGKTVAIKTVGLFSAMACAGLHVPCKEADICMNNQILCDIGDGQNIENNLSTFSAHIVNVLDILKRVTPESLVILDELGSGTDPAEGMGIAISILEQLRQSGCLFLVTTHYPEVKAYASKYREIDNARMAFDRENLKPLYRMEIGRAGDSCALYIAKRLGMPEEMLSLAAKEAYGVMPQKLAEELDLKRDRVTKPSSGMELQKIPVPRLTKEKRHTPANPIMTEYTRGDSVTVSPEGCIGIVVKPADEKGNVLVQVKGDKLMVNRKRLKLKAAAEQLYPDNYDFSIIFDTVENRKARHKMEKGYQGELTIYAEDQ